MITKVVRLLFNNASEHLSFCSHYEGPRNFDPRSCGEDDTCAAIPSLNFHAISTGEFLSFAKFNVHQSLFPLLDLGFEPTIQQRRPRAPDNHHSQWRNVHSPQTPRRGRVKDSKGVQSLTDSKHVFGFWGSKFHLWLGGANILRYATDHSATADPTLVGDYMS
ncbi:hypothetical protein TNCV_2433001 [Trichonephila clavipes]|nr:hypothetical protein TNCV_2433001 [Trichonephila clavipes]